MNAPNELSFLPDDYLENKAQRRANVICAMLFLVTMVSIGLAFTTSERSLGEVEKQYARVEQDFTAAAQRIQAFQQMQEKQRTMAHQAELSESLIEKVPRSLILANITNSLPVGVSLMDFSLTSTKRNNGPTGPRTAFEAHAANGAPPPVPQATVYDVSLKITGLAPTDVQVGDLLKRLKGVPIFKDVNLIISDWEHVNDKKNQDQQYRKFQIEMTLDPSANLEDAGTETAHVDLGK